MKRVRDFLCAGAIALSCSLANDASADDYRRQRRNAVRELEQYFNKQFVIQSSLVSANGPDYFDRIFGQTGRYKLFGCPESPVAQPIASKRIVFTSSDPAAWAGYLDGLNVPTRSVDGVRGGGFAVPTNSTARIPEKQRGPEFEFEFNGTWDVKRALVDAAAAEFEQCYTRLPSGRYDDEELQRLCPYRRVSRSEQKQTCVVDTRGIIGSRVPGTDAFEVTVYESTMCDFVGIGGSGETNTSFVSCFQNEYKGTATISSEPLTVTAFQRKLGVTKRRLVAKCTKSSTRNRMRPGRVKACVMAGMARAMAGIRK
jgi:hypothetical protein